MKPPRNVTPALFDAAIAQQRRAVRVTDKIRTMATQADHAVLELGAARARTAERAKAHSEFTRDVFSQLGPKRR